ncbi:vitamin K epoxide reductase family protein [Blastococcus capsensis]|uniref:vitamin K epoxide reductase family protein n=2 Tax=Bacillati TaxID=1783272 RepID=UPI0025423671|nr:vitamin K epoxide reductase family protein [Blastococcus capsensis]MDK3257028.1 vitamin K epoxide reductase family protein [Blastococcus capsensis]
MDRGITRPMARQAHGAELEQAGEEHSQQHGEDGGMPSRMDRLRAQQRQVLWIPWTLVLLGFWQLLAPLTLGYGNEALWAQPSGGRGVWFSDETMAALRASLMTWSDVVSGVALIVLGWRALKPDRPIAWWGACFVGIWLVFAPIVLWSPTASGFVNDSIVGLLVIALTILIPGMPNMTAFMTMGPPTPPGWSYNPSSWPQRAILVALAFVGLVVSRYLAAFQLGYLESVWDPFFGSASTESVLNSDISHMMPISDAGLGGIAYTFEFLMAFMGGVARWRTMPWMVAMFGVLVIPLGLAHVALVMSMPVAVHAWCTFCILAGLVMLPMVALTVDEVVAMGQHVKQSRRRGDRDGSTWKVFWQGGEAEGCTPDERTPDMLELPDRPLTLLRSSLWGTGAPLPLLAVAALGVLLYAVPGVLAIDIRSGTADVAHLGGAFIVVVAVVAMAEVLRPARLLNVAGGLGVASLVLLTGPGVVPAVVIVLTGLAVAALSVPRGPLHDHYGEWDRPARWPERRAA